MVYFITDGKNTKIGKSNNPRKRLLDLQVANANILSIKYLFNVPDKFEKILHSRFKKFKTESKNEWFQLDENVELILSRINHQEFKDIEKAKLKAKLINNSIFKDSSNTVKIKKTGVKLKQGKIKKLLDEIKRDLNSKKRISYKPYCLKYNFTSNEISFYVKSAKLSKAVYIHNSKL